MRLEKKHLENTYMEAKRLMLLIPVYPYEVTTKKLAKSTWMMATDIIHLVASLPADTPIAERKEGTNTYLTFPSIEAKRKAIGGVYAV